MTLNALHLSSIIVPISWHFSGVVDMATGPIDQKIIDLKQKIYATVDKEQNQ